MYGTVPSIWKAFNKVLMILNEVELGHKISRKRSGGEESARRLQERRQGAAELRLEWHREECGLDPEEERGSHCMFLSRVARDRRVDLETFLVFAM